MQRTCNFALRSGAGINARFTHLDAELEHAVSARPQIGSIICQATALAPRRQSVAPCASVDENQARRWLSG